MRLRWIDSVVDDFRSCGVTIEKISPQQFRIGAAEFYFVPAGETAPDHIVAKIVHEDIFKTRYRQLFARMKAVGGLNTERIHGRETEIRKINRTEAEDFFDAHHLLGGGGGKNFYGLEFKNVLVTVAAFSRGIRMKNIGAGYRSVELVRYCSKAGLHIVGGLSKLIRHYIKNHPADDIVTFIDKEWSDGMNYRELGFAYSGETTSLRFAVDRHNYSRRLLNSAEEHGVNEYTVTNFGNVKLTLKIH